MKRLITFLIVTLVTVSSVFAQLDTTDLKTQITSNFPDNTAGFITPARLRAVALDLMRSNANKLEDNTMTGVLTVNDSVKTLDGFYRWNGSGWSSISADTAVWGRSGGFILPLEYADKLSVDTVRIGGLIYPNDATVNIGTESSPFDTVFASVIAGFASSHNTLDMAYDEGGSGAGRTITADAGAIQVNGPFNSTIGNIQFVNDSINVPSLGYTNFSGVYEYTAPNLNLMGYFPDGLGTPVPEFIIRSANADTINSLSIFRGTNSISQFFSIEASYGGVGNFGYEVQMVGGAPQTKMFATSNDGLINLSVVNVDTAKIEFEFSSIVPFRCDSDKVMIGTLADVQLQYVDGNQADGYVLTSDASGNANWDDPYSWGEMGFADSSHALALTQNVPEWVTNSNNDIWSTAAVSLRNVSYSGDSLIIESDGTYFISGHLSVEGLNGSAIKAYTYKNGSIACSCVAVETLENNDIITVNIACDILPLVNGDALTIWIENTASGDDVTLVSGKMTIHKIGP